MRILIIEDDEEKIKNIDSFLRREFPVDLISHARSIASGLRSAISNKDVVDLIILDMSMYNYDVSIDEPSGGNPEPYAGKELLAQMKLRGISIPVIVVTMFDVFGDGNSKMSLEQLVEDLVQNFSPPFYDFVYYDARQDGWQTALRSQISSIVLP